MGATSGAGISRVLSEVRRLSISLASLHAGCESMKVVADIVSRQTTSCPIWNLCRPCSISRSSLRSCIMHLYLSSLRTGPPFTLMMGKSPGPSRQRKEEINERKRSRLR